MSVATEVLLEAGYNSADELVQDWALMIALSKIEQYQAECEFFEKKYGAKFNNIEQLVHQEKGIESFQQEEDLEDWEFSQQALEWWQMRVKELGNATANT